MPEFLKKYLNVPSLERLKKVGYFCGMDYASSDIYNFPKYISRYEHSVNVALITWNLTNDKNATLAALFHDVSTPCFSHVIDYMNKDYEIQESTEEYTGKVIKNDKMLITYLNQDNILLEDIINFKKYSVVDNDRPKLCADRLDGVILTGLYWVENLKDEDVLNILESITLYNNEDNEMEIGFKSIDIAKLVYETNVLIDEHCNSEYDNYMMELLASITKRAIVIELVSYEELFILTEDKLFGILNESKDLIIKEKLKKFRNIRKEEIPNFKLDVMKKRVLNPLVNGKRFNKKY